jgi:hypothetical protein
MITPDDEKTKLDLQRAIFSDEASSDDFTA